MAPILQSATYRKYHAPWWHRPRVRARRHPRTSCRCKKIGEAGSQQLLLDTQAVKGLLLEFPTAGESKSLLKGTVQVVW